METIAQICAEHILFAIVIILAASSVLCFLARHIKVPDIVLFSIVGIVLGPQIAGIIDSPATSVLSWMIIILFDDGVT